MTKFKVRYQDGSTYVDTTYIIALSKGLAREEFYKNHSNTCLILNIEG